MRLGIITFGTASVDATALDALRTHDVDIVQAETPITTTDSAKAEAERVARADCDGVLLLLGSDAVPVQTVDAAQFLGVPLLVAGAASPALFTAYGALAEWGARFERLVLTDTQQGGVLSWLTAHTKKARQPGFDAAQKLYGQVLHLPDAPTTGVDPAQWRQQFGVRILHGDLPNGTTADFTATDGDANGALCRHLLHLISGQEVHRYTVPESLPADRTFAQLYRRAGKFRLLATTAAAWPESHLYAGTLYGVSGDCLPALGALCEALDIETLFIF